MISAIYVAVQKTKTEQTSARILRMRRNSVRTMRRQTMTNGDKIKQMTDEELAKFICHNVEECEGCVGHEFCEFNGGDANGIIKWLKQEFEE